MLEVSVYSVLGIATGMVVVMGWRLVYGVHRFTPSPRRSKLGAEIDMPSVTVCIPARNEQHALAYCLERVLASSYERLEIIVLDDVSADNTSALIKSYASEGVRFVEGSPLPSGWLGRTHALKGLYKEASGTFLLYIDVDTQLAPDAIENIVHYALSHRKAMVSVLPRREDGIRASILFSPLRYFWEIIFSRRADPASASNAWLIRRDVIKSVLHEFEDVKNAILPETIFAGRLSATHEYAFLISTPSFGVGYEKKWRSQLTTGIRTLYPTLHKSTWLSVAAVVDLLILLTPFVLLISSFFIPFGGVHYAAACVAVLSMVLYGVYTRRVWRHGWYIGAILWPYLLLQELLLVIISTIQYKRGAITWKGRVIQPEAQN